MVKVVEVRHPGETYLQYWLGNATAIDPKYIKSVGIAWLFKEDGKWVFKPRITGNKSLFYNSIFFLRLALPLGLFIAFRWSGSQASKALMQSGLGWKLNGRFTLLFRIQSDKSSAAGVTGPNHGQAIGFDYGTH